MSRRNWKNRKRVKDEGNDTGEEKQTGRTLTAPPASVLPAARPPLGSKFRAAGGSTASRRCTGVLGEPACTKLMGNRSVWLLPSLEQGLDGGGRGGERVQFHEMGGSTGRTKRSPTTAAWETKKKHEGKEGDVQSDNTHTNSMWGWGGVAPVTQSQNRVTQTGSMIHLCS